MVQPKKKDSLRLLNDSPIEDVARDGLGFSKYATVLGEAAKNTPGPFTIGVFGDWGSGKTSLLQLIRRYCGGDDDIVTVWFNAWMYEREEHPIVPLIATVVREIERTPNWVKAGGEAVVSLLRGLRAVAYGFSANAKLTVPGFSEIEASWVAKDMLDRAEKDVNTTPDPLLDRSLYYDAFEMLSRSTSAAKGRRVIVFIDDLDRCDPEKAVRVLEAIKLVLCQPGFVFVIGVAREVIADYLQHRYSKDFGVRDFDGASYLDKIIQLQFPIPPHHHRVADLWKMIISGLSKKDQDALNNVGPIVEHAIGANPRSGVRFVNNLLIDRAIFDAIVTEEQPQQTRSGTKQVPAAKIELSLFAVARAVQFRWPVAYRRLRFASDEHLEELADALVEVEWNGEPDETLFGTIRPFEDLTELLVSPAGQSWLCSHEARRTTIDFLLRRTHEDSTISGARSHLDSEARLGLINLKLLRLVAGGLIPDFTVPGFGPEGTQIEFERPLNMDEIQNVLALTSGEGMVIHELGDRRILVRHSSDSS